MPTAKEEFINALNIWAKLSNESEEKVMGEVDPTIVGFWTDLSDEEGCESDYEVKGVTCGSWVYAGPSLVEGQEKRINEPLPLDEKEGEQKEKEKKMPLGLAPSNLLYQL